MSDATASADMQFVETFERLLDLARALHVDISVSFEFEHPLSGEAGARLKVLAERLAVDPATEALAIDGLRKEAEH